MTVLWALLACGGAEEAGPLRPDLSSRLQFEAVTVPSAVPVAVLPAEVVPGVGAVQDLGPGVAGRIVAWHVAPGDAVAAGDPLAELHSPELAGLAARARELGAVVAEHERLRELRAAAAEHGVASAADVREADAGLAEARAARDAVVRQLRALQDTSTAEGGTWTWRAPADGVVGEVSCSLGTVDAERTCVSLVRDGVLLEVQVPERYLAQLEVPTSARFTAADGRTWAFRELGRAPSVDPRSRARTFRFAVSGDDAPLAGVSGRALVAVAPEAGVHSVPAAAVTRIEGVPTVFLPAEEGGTPRPVEILGRDGDTLVVRGLADADEVAVRGVFLLKSLSLLSEEG
ncbi:MAG: efflux RND transporter periplasmic adaptor subunit [Myxococcota bacterium]